jgi:hypothetical protein
LRRASCIESALRANQGARHGVDALRQVEWMHGHASSRDHGRGHVGAGALNGDVLGEAFGVEVIAIESVRPASTSTSLLHDAKPGLATVTT